MVLNVRKIEVGGESLNIQKHNLNEWILKVAEDFREELASGEIQLSYNLDASIGEVPFDASQCEIVLSNLLMNALKFSNSGTIITISSKQEATFVRVSVSDQGIGLKTANTSKLFTRFYQGEHDRKGTGIGLSYARLLVEMHGGTIGAVNNEEKGTTFFYRLPLENETVRMEAKPYLNELLASPEKDVVEIADFSVSKYTALIVEDEPELRNYLKESLSECFKQIYVAENGADGLDITTRYFPDIVISDIMMPEIDGFELCKRIKSNIKISHIPVI